MCIAVALTPGLLPEVVRVHPSEERLGVPPAVRNAIGNRDEIWRNTPLTEVSVRSDYS